MSFGCIDFTWKPTKKIGEIKKFIFLIVGVLSVAHGGKLRSGITNMTYELAKKLKNAGFPFKKSLLASLNDETPFDENGTPYNVPTLSELIETCGKSFHGIEDVYVGGVKRTWQCILGGSLEGMLIDGETPEEAVVNLWIELNKK